MMKQEMEVRKTDLLSWVGCGKALFISLPEYCHGLGKHIWSCLFLYSIQFDIYLHINKDKKKYQIYGLEWRLLQR